MTEREKTHGMTQLQYNHAYMAHFHFLVEFFHFLGRIVHAKASGVHIQTLNFQSGSQRALESGN